MFQHNIKSGFKFWYLVLRFPKSIGSVTELRLLQFKFGLNWETSSNKCGDLIDLRHNRIITTFDFDLLDHTSLMNNFAIHYQSEDQILYMLCNDGNCFSFRTLTNFYQNIIYLVKKRFNFCTTEIKTRNYFLIF